VRGLDRYGNFKYISKLRGQEKHLAATSEYGDHARLQTDKLLGTFGITSIRNPRRVRKAVNKQNQTMNDTQSNERSATTAPLKTEIAELKTGLRRCSRDDSEGAKPDTDERRKKSKSISEGLSVAKIMAQADPNMVGFISPPRWFNDFGKKTSSTPGSQRRRAN
jgi:hypothetical protein